MADTKKFGFKISRVKKDALPPSQPATPEPETVASPLASSLDVGGRFRNLPQVFSFLGAVAGAGLASEAACRQSPDRKWWWVETDGPADRTSQLVWLSGGTPYVGSGNLWMPDLPKADQKDADGSLDISKWQPVEFSQLLGECALQIITYSPVSLVHVIAPGALGREIMERIIRQGFSVTVMPALRRPLNSDTNQGTLVFEIQSRGSGISASLVRSLSRLPYTVVARPVLERLWLDVYQRLPLEPAMLDSLIPSDEVWVFGGSEGHFCLHSQGQPLNCDEIYHLASALKLGTQSSPSNNGKVKLPPATPLRIVRNHHLDHRVDAVLLDNRELAWTRMFLQHRPLGDEAFLFLGNDHHLLTAVGGLTSKLPFGTPLSHDQIGGLYLECGCAFHPPLPPAALMDLFGLDDQRESVVVILGDETALRFPANQVVPAWTLWAGEAPVARSSLSVEATRMLQLVSAQLRKDLPQPSPAPQPETGGRTISIKERNRMLKQAKDLEHKGKFALAAEILESLGETSRAGRLYEKAALQLQSADPYG